MVYFRLIIASFKYCQEKFLTKIFLGKVCKSIDWPCVSPVQSMFLGNKRNFGREILFQITIFLSEIHNLQAMLKCQDQHLMNSKWLGGIFSERTVRHWGSGKVTAIILHSSIINQSSFIHQSSTNHHSFFNHQPIIIHSSINQAYKGPLETSVRVGMIFFANLISGRMPPTLFWSKAPDKYWVQRVLGSSGSKGYTDP